MQPLGFENEDLIWNAGLSQSERNLILSTIGLTEAAPSKDVTFMLLDNKRNWIRANVTAVWQRGQEQRKPYGTANLIVALMGIEPL